MKKIRVCGFAAFLMVLSGFAQADDPIEGYWRVIDDKSGFTQSIVQIKKDNKDHFYGRVIKILPRPNYTPKETCQNCPKPFENQKILGMTVLWNFKIMTETSRWGYVDGYVIDPLNGKIYGASARLSNDQRKMTLRGHVTGAKVLSRSQTWIRTDSLDITN
jgi:uncharacterized protein (DUF2147 family)